MTRYSKRIKNAMSQKSEREFNSIKSVVEFIKETSKEQESIDLFIKIAPSKALKGKQIRSSLTLPHRTSSKKPTILVFTSEADKEIAEKLNSDYVYGEDIIARMIDKNPTNKTFTRRLLNKCDYVVTPFSYLSKVAPLSRKLSSKGLMPSLNNGTLTKNLPETMVLLNSGKFLKYQQDKNQIIRARISTVGSDIESTIENIKVLVQDIHRNFSGGKGIVAFFENWGLSSTQGLGFKLPLEWLRF